MWIAELVNHRIFERKWRSRAIPWAYLFECPLEGCIYITICALSISQLVRRACSYWASWSLLKLWRRKASWCGVAFKFRTRRQYLRDCSCLVTWMSFFLPPKGIDYVKYIFISCVDGACFAHGSALFEYPFCFCWLLVGIAFIAVFDECTILYCF